MSYFRRSTNKRQALSIGASWCCCALPATGDFGTGYRDLVCYWLLLDSKVAMSYSKLLCKRLIALSLDILRGVDALSVLDGSFMYERTAGSRFYLAGFTSVADVLLLLRGSF